MGIGAGAASLYVPRYVSEVSPVAVRGALATLNQVCDICHCHCLLEWFHVEPCVSFSGGTPPSSENSRAESVLTTTEDISPFIDCQDKCCICHCHVSRG